MHTPWRWRRAAKAKLRRMAWDSIVMAESLNMPVPENIIEKSESEFPATSGSVFAAARERVLAAGQSVLQSEDGVIYEVFPDGHRLPVKHIEPPIPDVCGRRITIR
jgi:hypothetical protein